MVLVDNICGEILEIFTKKSAIKVAEERVKYYNSEISYRHHNKPHNIYAVMMVSDNTITIDYEQKGK